MSEARCLLKGRNGGQIIEEAKTDYDAFISQMNGNGYEHIW